jgi:hypothetical protein
MRLVSKVIRDSARGEDCTLRIPGACNFDPATTVLAHVPCGMGGMGMKVPDLFAVHACSGCHDALDGRTGIEAEGWEVVRALAETQMRLFEKGIISVKGVKA